MSCTDYDAERLREELARDERVSELGIEVTISSGKAFLHGKVPTPERREAVAEVAQRLLPHCTVVNEVMVTKLSSPQLEELS
ncbi:MAG TPA: BON domain-containing protein [Actinomycetota bacterium]|nr:BON domain-containing protein [Actinomycetota bacterium]